LDQRESPDLAFSSVQIWKPKSIKSGSSFALEFRLIPSLVLQTEAPGIDTKSADAATEEELQELDALVKDAITTPSNPRDYKLDFDWSKYRSLKLEPRRNSIETASVKPSGDSLTFAGLSAEDQTVKPFSATSWAWMITPTGSGQRSLYLSIQAKRSDGTVISTIVPVQLTVEQGLVDLVNNFISKNWKWIAGTLVIPLIIFFWGRTFGGETKRSPATPKSDKESSAKSDEESSSKGDEETSPKSDEETSG
jgi:hypothetical protein